MLKVVFLGTPDFAVPSLNALADDPRFEVELVVTQPDRPAGRGRRLLPPDVKVAALEHDLPIWQPPTLRAPEAVERLRASAADLFVVVAYGEILRRRVLGIPRHGTLNVHPSLLPALRGSSPIQTAILNGLPETGVSIIQLEPRLDAGPIVARQPVSLDESETAGSLFDGLARIAGELLPDTCARWVAGELSAVPQNDRQASYTQRLAKDDGRLDWLAAADALERRVRAMTPWPGAWTSLQGKRVVIEAARAAGELLGVPPGGAVLEGTSVRVRCGLGSLELLRVRPEGRQRMSAADWLRGLRPESTVRFDPAGR